MTSPCAWRSEDKGIRREAVLFACGANQTHGLTRTNADKRKAVETLMLDAEWSQWSNREIARRVGVASSLADDIRASLSAVKPQIDVAGRKVERAGTVYVQNTENI